MIELYALVAMVLVGAGIAAGVFVALVAGIRREERDWSLTSASPGHAASSARIACGVYTRGFEAPRGEPASPRRDLVLTGQDGR